MDSLMQVLTQWETEGIIILAVLTGVVVWHYVAKLWGAPEDMVLSALLGACIGAVAAGFYLMRHVLGLELGQRAFWFVVLYLWCALGMLFFAARNTSPHKLCLGLASQAGIVYALFVFL